MLTFDVVMEFLNAVSTNLPVSKCSGQKKTINKHNNAAQISWYLKNERKTSLLFTFNALTNLQSLIDFIPRAC